MATGTVVSLQRLFQMQTTIGYLKDPPSGYQGNKVSTILVLMTIPIPANKITRMP